jgi:hypothetical protein
MRHRGGEIEDDEPKKSTVGTAVQVAERKLGHGREQERQRMQREGGQTWCFWEWERMERRFDIKKKRNESLVMELGRGLQREMFSARREGDGLTGRTQR